MEELRKIIISELKQTWTHPAEVIADRILARIPDEKIIAEGIVTSDIPKLDIYFITGKQINSLFKGYKGKSIQLIIRQL